MKPLQRITQLTLRLPKELNCSLEKIAKDTGIAKNSLIVSVLWQFQKKQK